MRNPFRVFIDDFAKNDKECSDPQDAILMARFFFDIYNLFVASIKWEGLDPKIEPYYIEDCMFWDARGIFVNDEIGGKAFMKVALGGLPDIYNVPRQRWGYTPTAEIDGYNKSNSVLLRDNYAELPYCYSAHIHARELFNIFKTKQININAQRTPIVILSTDDQRLSYKILGENYNNFVPMIQLDDSLDLDRVTTLKLDAPFIVPGLEEEYRRVMACVLNEIGYTAQPDVKKEREIDSEVSRGNTTAEAYRNVRLGMRERACEGLKAIGWGDVSVKFNTSVPIVNSDDREDDTDEQVYNNDQEDLE